MRRQGGARYLHNPDIPRVCAEEARLRARSMLEPPVWTVGRRSIKDTEVGLHETTAHIHEAVCILCDRWNVGLVLVVRGRVPEGC